MDSKLFVEVGQKSLQKVDRLDDGAIDKWIVAVNALHLRIIRVEVGYMRIIVPKGWEWRVNRNREALRVAALDIANSCGEH